VKSECNSFIETDVCMHLGDGVIQVLQMCLEEFVTPFFIGNV
jgi:hypothetical protein